ncbi:hypothetical protein HRJ35_19525 [Shewanella oneidensis MR-1]|uniref:hypothetical protein n=1 Tax=Shewanella oneidensis TaxID=70863 RepID=UPI0013E8CBAA|nr:hypothetical protein [Shewanella oneidensis]MDX5999002.1 hypothetical protein [Shewanella oneidensis]QKG97969.1 hypothetical protein HRJ35_19525 [Shewanella oneidensis MR-1]
MPRSHGCERVTMPPTVTVATMPILTNPLAARSAKKLMPHTSLAKWHLAHFNISMLTQF